MNKLLDFMRKQTIPVALGFMESGKIFDTGQELKIVRENDI